MSNKIRSALETRLNSLSPAISTAWENVEFLPVVGTPWQRVNILWAAPENTTLGCARRFERGIFQITLHYPMNKGASEIDDRANLLVAHFYRGLAMTNDGQTVRITSTPSRKILGDDGKFFKMVVSINFNAEVFG
jgi:hypothetical protein